MIRLIKKILGIKPTVNYAKLIENGAIILDVRSKVEYASGHIEGSENIPVALLKNSLSKFKDKNRTIITCCASGIRSASAKNILKKNTNRLKHNTNSGSGSYIPQADPASSVISMWYWW